MTPGFTLIVIGFGMYYLKRWTAGKVMHHPELQTIDAIDRMLHCLLVVGVVWICVSLASNFFVELPLFTELITSTERAREP